MRRPLDLIRVLAVALLAASPAIAIEGPSVAGGAPLAAIGGVDQRGRDAGQPLVGRDDRPASVTAIRSRRAPTDAGGRDLVAVSAPPLPVATPAPAGALSFVPARRPHGRALVSSRSARGPPPVV